MSGARADAIAKGITINGLPIINDRLQPSGRPHLGAPMESDGQIMHPASLGYPLGCDNGERRLRQRRNLYEDDL